MEFSPGLILRRCELDEEGIAYWEPPTYIRCVSIDYRNIQMMVRLVLGGAQETSPLFEREVGAVGDLQASEVPGPPPGCILQQQ